MTVLTRKLKDEVLKMINNHKVGALKWVDIRAKLAEPPLEIKVGINTLQSDNELKEAFYKKKKLLQSVGVNGKKALSDKILKRENEALRARIALMQELIDDFGVPLAELERRIAHAEGRLIKEQPKIKNIFDGRRKPSQ